MKKKVVLLLSSALIIVLSACHEGVGVENKKVEIYYSGVTDIYDEHIPLLNTFVKVDIYNAKEINRIEEESQAIMSYYHKLLDSHHYYFDETKAINNIKVINDSYGTGRIVDVDAEIIKVLNEAILMMELSNGYFNPFLDSLISLWSPKFSPYPLENEDPSVQEIKEALACVPSLEQIKEILIIDETNNTIQFDKMEGCNQKVAINLGGFAKGFVLNEVSAYLNEQAISYMLNMGNSSLYFNGQEEERTWMIGTTSPYEKSYSFVLELPKEAALSTSGDANQLFLKQNEEGSYIVRSHLLNPYTGYSESKYRMVSVISDNNQVSEVLSTALFIVQSEEEQQKIIRNFEKHYNISIQVVWYYEEEYGGENVKLIMTSGIMEYIKLDSLEEKIKELIVWEEFE
jgi:Membrane-associated lipoprotein involved in thiamine biosynthesis